MQKRDTLFEYDTKVIFEELARFDVRTLIQLVELAPNAIKPDALEDFKADFAVPG